MSTVIKLNVGGKVFCTFWDTLKHLNYFQELFQGNPDTKKEVFIDRSPELFEEILYFLRTCEILINDQTDLLELKEEALFYQLDDLVKSIDHAINNLIVSQQKHMMLMTIDQFKQISSIDLQQHTNGTPFSVANNISDQYEVITFVSYYDPSKGQLEKVLVCKK